MTLHFHEYGSPGNPVLLILHGLFGSSDNWHTLARRWGAQFHVFAPDARNHGRSPHSDEFNHAAMVRDTVEFMDAHSIPRAAMLGHSMGGRTLMELALTHPGRVEKLVVVDIAPRTYEPHHQSIFNALTAVRLETTHDRAAVEQALAGYIREPAVRQFLIKNLQRAESGAFHWKMNLPVLINRYTEILKGLDTPGTYNGQVLVVRGARSGYIRDDDIIEFQEIFPEMRVVTLDAGHWIHAERPDEFSRVVAEFLAK